MKGLFSSILCVLLLQEIASEEPQCSKFHYEAQTLDKMIRMEVKVETIENEILKTNQLVLESLEALKNERETFKAELSDFNKAFTELKTNILDEAKDIRNTLLTPEIAFKARHVTDLSVVTDQTIVFSTTMLNEGGAYDNTTGIFTAPVSGSYLFTTQLCVRGGLGFFYAIVCDNVVNTGGYFYDSGTTCFSADAILALRPGQKVWMKCTNGSGSSNLILTDNKAPSYNYWNTFAGTLIHK